MNDMSKEVNRMSENKSDVREFRDSAIKWSEHCLNTYAGETLTKGLKISESIAHFLNQLEVKE
jgi:hypothetical protein